MLRNPECLGLWIGPLDGACVHWHLQGQELVLTAGPGMLQRACYKSLRASRFAAQPPWERGAGCWELEGQGSIHKSG